MKFYITIPVHGCIVKQQAYQAVPVAILSDVLCRDLVALCRVYNTIWIPCSVYCITAQSAELTCHYAYVQCSCDDYCIVANLPAILLLIQA